MRDSIVEPRHQVAMLISVELPRAEMASAVNGWRDTVDFFVIFRVCHYFVS